MTETSKAETARARPWLRVVLGVSLAVNLLVIGLVAGAMWRFGASGAPGGAYSAGAAIYHALPRADRRAIREIIRDARATEGGPGRKEEAAEIISALRAEPFEIGELEQIIVRHLALRHERSSHVRAAWLSQVKAMDDATRNGYADRLEEKMARPKKRRGWWKREDNP